MATLTERLQFILEVNNRSAVKGIQEFGKASEKALGDADKKLDQVAGKMVKGGAAAVAFAGVASVALYKVGSAAGDQNAALAAMEQSFGDASGTIQKFADDSVRAVGLSRTAALDAATSFAGIARQMGLSGEAAAQFSIEQVKLAADLAAFKNVSPEQALQDLVAAYSGSTEVMQKYQVSLNDTILKQTLLATTGEKITGTLTPQQKALAIQAALLEQTATQQGQWNRELDSNEAKTAMFKASLDDLAAGIGQGVVPVMSSMLDGLNGAVNAFNGLPDPVKRGAGGIAAFGVAAAGGLGALSLLVGQAIKMRDNLQPLVARLRNTEGGLTRVGKAAAVAGTAMATLAAVEIGDSILFSGEGEAHADALTRKLQALTIAIGDLQAGSDDGTAAMAAFRNSVAEEGHHALTLNPFTNMGHIIENVGDQLQIVGSSAKRDIEQVDRAFKTLLDQSPAQAQSLLDTWRAQADALDHNSGQYRDNTDAIAKYQGWLDLTTGSEQALTAATTETGAAQSEAAENLANLQEILKRNVTITKERVDTLKDELSAIEDVRDALQDQLDARDESADAATAYDRAQNDFLKTMRDLPDAVKNAKGDQLELNEVYWAAADAAEAAAKADVEKWRSALAGQDVTLSNAEAIDIENRALLRSVATMNGPEKQALVERIARINNIPTDVATYIVASIDTTSVEDADKLLADVSEDRKVAVKVDEANSDVDKKTEEVESAEYAAEVAVEADTSHADAAIAAVENGNYTATVRVNAVPGTSTSPFMVPGSFPAPGHAQGTVTTGPEVAVIGEDGTEVVIPLTKPDRIRELMARPGVGSTILNALAGGQVKAMANGGVVTRGAIRGGGAVELRGVSFADALETVFAGYADLLGATDDLTESQHHLNDAFNENGKTLDVNTEKGRANRDAVVSNWEAVKELAAAQFDQGASVEDVTAAMHRNLDQLRQQLAFFGLTNDEIDTYLQSMNATPAAIDQVTAALQEQQRVADVERQVRTEDYLYDHQKLNAAQYLRILRDRLAGLEEYSDEWIRIMDQIDQVEADRARDSEQRLRDWADAVQDAFDRADDAASGAQSVAEGLSKVFGAVVEGGIGAGTQGRSAVLDQLNAIADAAKAAVEGGASVTDVMAAVNADIARLREAVVQGGGSAAEFDRLRSQAGRTNSDFQGLLQAVQQTVTVNVTNNIDASNMTPAQIAQAVAQGITSAATSAAASLRAA